MWRGGLIPVGEDKIQNDDLGSSEKERQTGQARGRVSYQTNANLEPQYPVPSTLALEALCNGTS